MKKENNNIQIDDLLSLKSNQPYEKDLLKLHFQIENCSFTNSERYFKFQKNTLESLQKFDFNGIVDTTNKEIENIKKHNNNIVSLSELAYLFLLTLIFLIFPTFLSVSPSTIY